MKPAHAIGIAIAALIPPASIRAAAPEPAPLREAASSRLSRRLTLEIVQRPLREAVQILEHAAGLRLQPLWQSDRHVSGLDPDSEVSFSTNNETVLTALTRFAEVVDPTGATTWQLAGSSAVQIGPRSRLNAFKRVQVYDVSDLLRAVPDHRRGPVIDLQQALQATGSSAPIVDREDDPIAEQPSTREKAEELADLIRDLVETDQWIENGGEGGSIRIFRNALIINAPDYVHRAIQSK